MIVVNVSSDLANGERRVDAAWTFEELRKKFEFVTGIPPAAQELRFYSPTNRHHPIDKETTLGELGVADGWLIRVIDSRPESEREFVPDENVVGYKMSESEYEKRPDTVLAWKRKNKLGRFADPAASAGTSKQPEVEQAQQTGEIASDEEEL